MAGARWAGEAYVPSCAPPSWPARRVRMLPSPMDATLMPFPGPSSARLVPIFRRGAGSLQMATSLRGPTSTRDRLLRARDAATRLARLTTAQKNTILLLMADAIAANAAGILQANQADLDSSGLAGAMRDRLLLNPERITAMVSGVREVAG